MSGMSEEGGTAGEVVATQPASVKVLLAVDGSECGERAVAHLLRLTGAGLRAEVHVLNVQIPVDSGHARLFVSHEELQHYYREEGLAALKPAREQLEAAGVACKTHIAIGHTAETIVRFAVEGGFHSILLASRGRGGIGRLLLGSVATEVARTSSIPVTIAR